MDTKALRMFGRFFLGIENRTQLLLQYFFTIKLLTFYNNLEERI